LQQAGIFQLAKGSSDFKSSMSDEFLMKYKHVCRGFLKIEKSVLKPWKALKHELFCVSLEVCKGLQRFARKELPNSPTEWLSELLVFLITLGHIFSRNSQSSSKCRLAHWTWSIQSS